MSELERIKERFILHWGEMGTQWGVNRSQSQIHALLYLSDRPLHAEDIVEGNVVALKRRRARGRGAFLVEERRPGNVVLGE